MKEEGERLSEGKRLRVKERGRKVTKREREK